MVSLYIAILLPFLAAVFVPFFAKVFRRHVGWAVLIVPLLLFAGFLRFIPKVAAGETFHHTVRWIPSYELVFSASLDGLSLIFGLLITGIGSLVILYSIFYLSSRESLHHFYLYLLLFMGAMLGVVFSDNLMVLYVFWELTSISSFLLIAFWYQRKRSRYGAQKALLITVSGGIALLAGFIMLYTMTGTMSIREMLALIDPQHPLFIPALVLILIGAFTKSAQFPFHIWLPDAMEAPTPVSAYLHSATMVKAGIYLVARFTPLFGVSTLWFWLVIGTGLITLFWGAFNAIRQTDLKALLAFSTISQLGLIMSLFGLASAAFQPGSGKELAIFAPAGFAALFHLVNHSTFKGALFMAVGIIDHQLGTRDIRRLGGLMSFMPVSFTVILIGSLSMAGLPPFNGFLSKEMFFGAMLGAGDMHLFAGTGWWTVMPAIAWLASVFTFIYSILIVWQTFFGKFKPEKIDHEPREGSIGILISPIVLASLVVLIFFFPNVLGDYLLRPAMDSIFPGLGWEEAVAPISAWHGVNPALIMTAGVIVFGILLYKLLRYWKLIYWILPDSWSFNRLYDSAVGMSEKRSTKLTKTYMTGDLRHYLTYIYVFFILAAGGVLLYTGAFHYDTSGDAPAGLYETLLAVVMLAAVLAIPFAKSRLSATLLNGAIGYSIALFFVFFRAPDLALTQLIVETVTTALFLLCFRFLPEWKKEEAPKKSRAVRLSVSIGTGVVFVLIALSVNSGRLFETVSAFFEDAYELTGGNNIVNSILGDFRAFDTMLEVVVLLIGGLGVYSLIKLREKKGGAKD